MFPFRFMIQFELNFVKGIRSVSFCCFRFLCVDVSCSKTLYFLHYIAFAPLKSVDSTYVGLFFVCLFCLILLFIYTILSFFFIFLLREVCVFIGGTGYMRGMKWEEWVGHCWACHASQAYR